MLTSCPETKKAVKVFEASCDYWACLTRDNALSTQRMMQSRDRTSQMEYTVVEDKKAVLAIVLVVYPAPLLSTSNSDTKRVYDLNKEKSFKNFIVKTTTAGYFNMTHRCDLHRRHPSPEDAAACPGSLDVLQPPTRHRRNAIVNHMRPDLDDDVPSSPTASWETISNTTHSSRAVTPLELPGAAYPTPSTSQRQTQGPRDHILNGPAFHCASPFTPRAASPAPLQDDDDDDNIVVHHSYDLLGNLQTTSPFQNTPARRDRFTTPLPPAAPPPSPMAPRKSRRLTPPPSSFRSTMLRVESIVRRDREAEAANHPNAATLATATAAPTPLHDPADIALPSIELDPNIPGAEQLREIRALRRSTADLTRQLAASTERSNLYHLRANIANEHRNRAVEDRAAAEAQLQAVRDERDTARGGWMTCTMKCRALFLLVLVFGLYVFYRGVLYEPEFEYIMKRSGEVLGLFWEAGRVRMDQGLEEKWREMTGH